MKTNFTSDDPMIKVWTTKNEKLRQFNTVIVHKNYKGSTASVRLHSPEGVTVSSSADLMELQTSNGNIFQK